MPVAALYYGEMLEHITDEERERMAAFSETPAYRREPEQLLPDTDEDIDE